MDSLSTILPTPYGNSYPPPVNLKELSDSELEALLQNTRDTTLSLEVKLEKRYSPIPAAPLHLIIECKTKL